MIKQKGKMEALCDKYFPRLWEILKECRDISEGCPPDPKSRSTIDGIEEFVRKWENELPTMKYIDEAQNDMVTQLDKDLAMLKGSLARYKKTLVSLRKVFDRLN